jgi:hypothetical protein
VWKVRRKVLLIVTDDDPDLQITAGRHLDKQHWISIGQGTGITAALMKSCPDAMPLETFANRLPADTNTSSPTASATG